jgi:hypothetical protein
MATVKMTFTFDEPTAAMLRSTAARLGKPQSAVVREAVAEYSARSGRLSEAERLRLLAVFDELVPAIQRRPHAEVERELAEIREARRGGGRRSRPEDR